ncbi:MAG: DUF1801 domain-containing protein [Chloroflexi bacterium]|nr:DUF1801 domain-containing protein [Chloroflexota bacterium]
MTRATWSRGDRSEKEALLRQSKEVDAWFKRYANPMKDVVLRVRAIVLGADPRIEECVKWQAPTFTYRGNLASFYPKTNQHASLMFHTGRKFPGSIRDRGIGDDQPGDEYPDPGGGGRGKA